MATVFAVTKLFDDVVARFALDATAYQVTTLALAAIVNGQTYGATINGNVIAYTAGPADTFDSVYLALDAQITALAIAGLRVVRDDTLPGFMFTIVATSALVLTAPVNTTTADISPPAPVLVPNTFGWRAPDLQGVAPRIMWVPGDDGSGAIGQFGAGKYPGRQPARPLGQIGELVTVYVQGLDASAPEDERKQYEAARALLDAFYRAVYLAAHGTFEIVSAGWVISKKVRRHGATIRVLLSVEAMIPDAPYTVAPVNVNASVTSAISPDGDPISDEDDANVPDLVTPGP